MGQLWEELQLVEIVLGFAGDFNVSVRLDLGQFWAVLVMVAVGATALWANVFHWVGVLGV